MANLPTEVKDIIENASDDREEEAIKLIEIMSEVTGEKPEPWHGGIIGFGSYHYKYKSGREGDWFLTGFAIRKNQLSIYIISGFDQHEDIMKNLGKYKTGKSCLYVKKLEDIDFERLKNLISKSVEEMKTKHDVT